ncbi:MAG: serine/threonine protein kinase [Oscillospiraceae bacterium]|nr:serine/threonine protein kinase [Oscillospiraceae bacterium]
MEKNCIRCSSPVKGGRCPVCGFDCSDELESMNLTAGTVLDDRYVIGRVIGSGGWGVTYLAYDTQLEKSVAIKEYYPKNVAVRAEDNVTLEPFTSVQEAEFLRGAEKFEQEAEILSRLKDETDVINIYNTFRQNGTIYYVMEYIHGVTLSEYTRKNGKISEGQALHAALCIASVFSCIHSRNIIHRDLSPNNVMITVDGKVRLVDFGNARPFISGENSMTVAVKHGYAPLEQYQHHGNHGPWTDIYSLGTVLYYGLTLKTPEDPMSRLDDDREFQSGLAELSGGLGAVINKMSSVRISQRYRSSEELTEDLKALDIAAEGFEGNAES